MILGTTKNVLVFGAQSKTSSITLLFLISSILKGAPPFIVLTVISWESKSSSFNFSTNSQFHLTVQ